MYSRVWWGREGQEEKRRRCEEEGDGRGADTGAPQPSRAFRELEP